MVDSFDYSDSCPSGYCGYSLGSDRSSNIGACHADNVNKVFTQVYVSLSCSVISSIDPCLCQIKDIIIISITRNICSSAGKCIGDGNA